MPAAAVIPAPLAYIKVVAVKKLVVEFCAVKVARFGANGLAFIVIGVYFPASSSVLGRCFVT